MIQCEKGGEKMGLKENIKKMRTEQGMTLEEVGKRISVSKQTVQRYESGQIPNIPYDKVVALADVFGCSPGCLMGWTETDFLIDIDTDMLVESLENLKDESDKRVLTYLKKLMSLNSEHQKTIFSNIDFLLSQERGD